MSNLVLVERMIHMPLRNYRVLDLTRLLPGPYCTMILADFGAEVIKVEDTNVGDYTRHWEMDNQEEQSPFYEALNRNKKSVSIDLKAKKGKEIFKELVKEADVVVESFRPGVMERLELGYDTLKTVNPSLIYCAITGFGQTGPYMNDPGHDINYLSLAGLLYYFAREHQKPAPPPVQIADIGGGALPATIGILMALLEKEQSGKGQFIDISMLDNIMSWMSSFLPDYLQTKKEPQPGKLVLSGAKACYEVYETKDGRYLAVGALEEKFWKTFCETIGKESFIPLLNAPLQEQHRLKTEIQNIISQKTLVEWTNIFAGKEACVTPVHTLDEMVKDPQLNAREIIKTVHGKRYISPSIHLSETPGAIKEVAPKQGEHTEEVLTTLGLSEEDIHTLKVENVIKVEK